MTTVYPAEDKIEFNRRVMEDRFGGLLRIGCNIRFDEGYPNDPVYTYKISELRNLTSHLMHYLDFHYDCGDGPFRKVEDFSEDEKIALRPFAYFLSLMDGNAFYNPDPQWHEQTERGFLDAYLPAAYAFLGDRRNVLDHLIRVASAHREKDK